MTDETTLPPVKEPNTWRVWLKRGSDAEIDKCQRRINGDVLCACWRLRLWFVAHFE